jgi:adenylate kinase
VYHTKFNPPKVAGVCDKCGEKLYQRKDDNEEVIKTRFVVYEQQTGNRLLQEFWLVAHRFHYPQAQAVYDELRRRRGR